MTEKRYDGRKTKLHLAPYDRWIPDGERNFLFDLHYNGEKVGELQAGTDGFAEMIFKVDDVHLKIKLLAEFGETRKLSRD